VNRCKDGGVKQALVIGGSAQPIGDFHSSLQLLETGLFQGWIIGIAGHPDGSPDISDKDLEKAMIDKKSYADYIITQWCLDVKPIAAFLSKQTLPVRVGITGPLKISSLLKFANFVVVTHSPAEIVMDFTRLLPGVAKAKVHSRIIMAPPHAKAYLMALTDNIKKFESKYGEIKSPGQEGFTDFGVKPPEGSLPN